MNKEDLNFELHIFVCTNKRDGRAACEDQEMSSLRNDLKQRLFVKYGRRVRVNASGCLGHCAKGGVAVIYPQNIWLTGLNNKSIDQIESEIESIMGDL